MATDGEDGDYLMADIADVEQAIADLVASVLYPSGPAQASCLGSTCRIYRGWPNSQTLNSDLAAGNVNVTVTTDNDFGRTTTRYLPTWSTVTALPGVSMTHVHNVVTVSGVPRPGDVAGIIADAATFAYRIQAGDTTQSVASNLAQLIQASRPVSVTGTSITIPGAVSITTRAVCDGSATYEVRRQEKNLRIICWCPSPSIRDEAADIIDAAFTEQAFLKLADASQARVIYYNTASYDQTQNALLYRRDLVYTVEYGSNITFNQPAMIFGASDLNGNTIFD